MASSKAFEAAGLLPGNENNAAGCYFSPEKPCCTLFTECTFAKESKENFTAKRCFAMVIKLRASL